ncbi:hypothetical protein PRIPAC_96271 [Pristionchus pacificus]|uniref:DUF7153 domain-containing protein n=1 Tax=Pristionchus pacificus TaxID=54126 RepID=A0A2A6BCY3_PRIPA|nr:hypothetical protein PRIPAC_96271 [Pristionchus pacificus]|eukprot:PDM63706.1 hypothetical protein PRIPAC_49679 [Pristionchus pacificus]
MLPSKKYSIAREEDRQRLAARIRGDFRGVVSATLPRERDPLSEIGYDTVVQVFSNLSKVDLFNMSAANQVYNGFVADYFKIAPKKAAAYLEIAHFDRGTAFRLIQKDGSELNFLYLQRTILHMITADKQERGVLYEYRQTFLNDDTRKPFENHFIDNSVAEGVRNEFNTHFFNRIIQSLKHYAPEGLNLNNFEVSSSFMRRFKEKIENKFVRLCLMNVVVNEDLEQEFLDFLLDKKFTEIEVLLCDNKYGAFMDAGFAKKMACDPKKNYILNVMTDRPKWFNMVAFAPDDFASTTLIKFDIFRNASLVVKANDVLLDAMLARAERKVEGHWKILLDKKIKFLDRMRLKRESAEYTLKNPHTIMDFIRDLEDDEYIIRKDTNCGIRINWLHNQLFQRTFNLAHPVIGLFPGLGIDIIKRVNSRYKCASICDYPEWSSDPHTNYSAVFVAGTSIEDNVLFNDILMSINETTPIVLLLERPMEQWKKQITQRFLPLFTSILGYHSTSPYHIYEDHFDEINNDLSRPVNIIWLRDQKIETIVNRKHKGMAVTREIAFVRNCEIKEEDYDIDECSTLSAEERQVKFKKEIADYDFFIFDQVKFCDEYYPEIPFIKELTRSQEVEPYFSCKPRQPIEMKEEMEIKHNKENNATNAKAIIGVKVFGGLIGSYITITCIIALYFPVKNTINRYYERYYLHHRTLASPVIGLVPGLGIDVINRVNSRYKFAAICDYQEWDSAAQSDYSAIFIAGNSIEHHMPFYERLDAINETITVVLVFEKPMEQRQELATKEFVLFGFLVQYYFHKIDTIVNRKHKGMVFTREIAVVRNCEISTEEYDNQFERLSKMKKEIADYDFFIIGEENICHEYYPEIPFMKLTSPELSVPILMYKNPSAVLPNHTTMSMASINKLIKSREIEPYFNCTPRFRLYTEAKVAIKENRTKEQWEEDAEFVVHIILGFIGSHIALTCLIALYFPLKITIRRYYKRYYLPHRELDTEPSLVQFVSLLSSRLLFCPTMASDFDTCPFYINLSMHDKTVDSENNATEPFAFPSTLSSSHPSLEELTFRRVVTVEKECLYPAIDFVFIRGHPTSDNETESAPHNGTYARLDDVTRPAMGYLLFAFKSMDYLHSANFLSQWKAWTGAKYLYHMLPSRLHIDFMAFFKKVSGSLDFEFLMVAHVPNLLIEAAAALNLLHYMRQKVCAHIAAYKLTDALARKLHISRDFCSNVTTTCMKLAYSNNTATLSFPGEATISVDGRKRTDSNGNRNSFAADELPVEAEKRRNSLTRTISIYDFPSINESNERAFSSSLRPVLIVPSLVHPSTLSMHSLMISAPSPFLVHAAPAMHHSAQPWSTTSYDVSRRQHESRHLTALPLSLLIAHPEIRRGTRRRPILVTPPESTSQRSPLHPTSPTLKGIVEAVKAATNAVDSRVGRRKGEIDPDEDIKGGIEDEDEERFRRLRTAYFNSPDYDRSERPSSVEKLIRKEEEEEEKEKSLPQLGTAHSTPTKSVETSLLKQPKERKSI